MSEGSAPTLDTVARHAGVSRQTVSNALHRPERLRAETRERVLAAVAELGYRPSLAARQLATRRSTAIAVRAHSPQPDGVSGLLLDAFLHALAEAGRTTGHRVLLYPASADDDTEVALIEDLLLTGSVGAVVLTAVHLDDGRADWLLRDGTPFCTFGRPWGRQAAAGAAQPHDWVDVDGADGCAQAVAHLVGLGCRRVGFVGWPPDGGAGDDRRAGWRAEAAGRGVLAPEVGCEDVAADAEAAVAGLLTGPQPPDGLVCASDTLALGAWRAAGGTGQGPRIVGFDATPVMAALGVPSIAQPIAEVAHTCLDLVVARLEGTSRATRGVLLRPRLADPRSPGTTPGTAPVPPP